MKRGKRGTGRHDASIYLSKRSKCIWRSLRLRCWRRKTLRGSDVSCGLLVGGGQLALREFQVIAYDQRHILIEVFDATGNAIYSEIGAEYPARRCAQSRIFHPLPERVMLTQVGLRAIIDAGAQLVVSIQITFRQYAENFQAVQIAGIAHVRVGGVDADNIAYEIGFVFSGVSSLMGL